MSGFLIFYTPCGLGQSLKLRGLRESPLQLSLCLLRETNFAHQFGIAWVSAEGIHREVGPDAYDNGVVFLIGGV